jgi:retron-type reverse transcriptase
MLPVLYPFGTQEQWLKNAPAFFDQADMSDIRRLLEKKIIPLKFGPEIAIYLGISPKLVSHMVMAPRRYYNTFEITKKNGGRRLITSPRVFLKTIQRYVLDCVLSQITPHDAAVGFRRGLNCAAGARRHVGRPYVWNIDLSNFFPTITKKQVTDVFAKVGYPDRAAHFLAGLCCLEDRLPQGAPTSPALANLIIQPLDSELTAIAESAEATYTRYADDMTFSFQELIPVEFRTRVVRSIENSGFTLNAKKTRLMGPAVRREVTGLTINEKVSIPRHKRREVRAYFHRLSRSPEQYVDHRQKALGYARWLFDYHPSEGAKALEIVHRIPQPELHQ